VQAPITDHTIYSTAETAIGYGLTSPALQPDTSGLRRIRQNIPIVCIPKDPKSFLDCYSIDPEYAKIVAENEFVVGDGTCEGDSGSSAFAQSSMTAGAPISLGVLSRGGADDAGTQCQGGIYTRLDKWRDLLVSTVKTAAQKGGYALPAWTAPIASDAGTDASDASAADLGATCARDADCASGLCAPPPNAASASLVCTRACDSANVCPSGFACAGDPPGCFVGVTPAPTTSQVQASGEAQAGCAIAFVGDPTNPLPWAQMASALAGLMLVRRTRRARAAARS